LLLVRAMTRLPTTVLPVPTTRLPTMVLPVRTTLQPLSRPAQRYSACSPSSWSCCNPRARGQA
jgi:hypothetical protein